MSEKRGPRGLLRKTVDFFGIFTRSRRGILGIIILLFFTVFAFTGQLLAPYDPVRQVVGARAVPPVWYGYFTPGQSQNIRVVSEPEFNSPSSTTAWKLNTSLVALSHSADTGEGNSPGSLKFTYNRDSSTPPPGVVGFESWSDFHYPFKGPAGGFSGSISIRATGVSGAGPVSARIFLEDVARNITNYFTTPIVISLDSAPDTWAHPGVSISGDSNNFETKVLGFQQSPGIDIAEKLFRGGESDYKYGVEIRISDNVDSARNVQVYIDNFFLNIDGNSWGLLGTDDRHLDLFSRLSYGARISLLVGILASVISIVLGLFAGLMAGYLGRFTDEVIMRFTDMLLVLPGLPLLLVIIAVLGANIWNIIIVISLLGWMGFARTVRSQVISIKERPFIEASKAVGAGTFHITLRHVFPNIIGLTYVSLALAVPGAIISEAALSWLGLGDPTIPSWGKILYDWQQAGGPSQALWWVIPPGVCIAAISLSFVLIGYALDEVLNPKLRVRR